MMNKSLLAHSVKSSRKSIYGFQQVRILKRRCAKSTLQKKSRRFRRLLKLITGRRQTEWTGATRCPNKDDPSHKRESLINRKRAISFRLCLPCRPLAECGCITAERLRRAIGPETLTTEKTLGATFASRDIRSIQLVLANGLARRIYSLRREGLMELRDWLDTFWDAALAAFKEEVEKT
jgi:hypothetical protein